MRELDAAQRVTVLNSIFHPAAGRIASVSALKDFPLGLTAERTLTDGRTVRIGNAAQTLHPVAGQGLNLGLRDAFELVHALARNPDVDAVYRMLFPLPFVFDKDVEPVALLDGAWCPFNSQNTTFFKKIFPLLYLPAHCSFRMTDIWRSFVAQRVLHHLGYPVMFHECTVWQERNEHSLHRDFCDEVPGYVNNHEIRTALMALDFDTETDIYQLLLNCYACLMDKGWVGREEETLLATWISDLKKLG